MSKDIHQIFIANPALSILDTDLFYLGRSPYSTTNDLACMASVLKSYAQSGTVISVVGTDNQINVSGSSTANLSLANGVSIGSYQSISPPVGGAILPGIMGIGTSSPNANSNLTIGMSSLQNGIYITGTTQPTSVAATFAIDVETTFKPLVNMDCVGISSQPTFIANTSITINNAIGFYAYNNLLSNVNIITNSISIFADSGTGSTGTVLNAFGIFCKHPLAGTNKVTAYFEDVVSIGTTIPSSVAILQLDSTTKGFLPPRMTTAQKNAISAVAGLEVYDTNVNDLQFFNGTNWVSTSGDTSVTGTTNQIICTPTTGAVVVSLSNGLSIGSYQATTAPTGGIIMPGYLGVGTSTVNAYSAANFMGNFGNILLLAGTAQSAVDGSNNQAGLNVAPIFAPTNGATVSAAIYANARLQIPSGKTVTKLASLYLSNQLTVNLGSISTLYGVYFDGGDSPTLVTQAWGAYIKTPAATTSSKAGIYTDSLSIGNDSVFPAAGNLAISGLAVLSGSTPDPYSNLTINTNNQNAINLMGTTTVGTGPVNGVLVSTVFSPNLSTSCFGIGSQPTFSAPNSYTYTYVVSLYAYNSLNSNIGTITNSIGLFVDAGSTSTGTVNNAFGIYCKHPLGGTNQVTAYFENVVSIGTTSPNASALLQIESTTQGFLQPRLTTTQRNAIFSPATGLSIYNLTTLDTEVWNGSIWVGASGSGVTSLSGTTNQIVVSSSTGSVSVSLSNGLSIGSYQATTAPTGGIIMPGYLGVGSSTVNAYSAANFMGNFGNILLLAGTAQSAVDGSNNQAGLNVAPIFAPTNGATVSAAIYANARLQIPSGKTVTKLASLYLSNQLTVNLGSISTLYGVYFDGGDSPTLVTQAWGAYIKTPAATTSSKAGIYTDSISIGLDSVFPSTGSLIATGYGMFGGSSILSAAILQADSVTQGFLPPRMTTAQRDSIGSPVAGLMIFNTDHGDIDLYNGLTWIDMSISGVLSITGTSNQINASASTGNVTLSLSSTIITPGTLAINAMTQGSVLFSGASSVVSQDNSNLFWDDTNNLFGIGTATPTARIHLAANVVSSTNNIVNQCGFYNNVSVRPSANITSAALQYISGTFSTAGGTIGTAYGLNIGNFSIGATNNVALRVVSPTSGSTSNTAIYTDNLSVGYSNVSPPSSGVIISGFVGIGVNNPGSFQLVVTGAAVPVVQQINGAQTSTATLSSLATSQAMLYIDGTSFPTSGSSNSFGIFLNQGFKANTSQTITNAAALNISSTFTTNVNIITNTYGLRILGGSAGAGTMTNVTNAYIATPLSGTTATGNIGVQIDGVDSIGSTTGTKYSLYLSGTITGDDSALIAGIYNNVSLEPTTNSRSVYGIRNNPAAVVYSTNTINNVYGIYTNISVNPGSGSVTNAYGGYFVAPVSATNLCALYTDNLAVGYTAVTPPSNGAIISGQVAIGVNAPGTAPQLLVQSALAAGVIVQGTQTATGTIATVANAQAAIAITATLDPTAGSSLSAGLVISPTFISPTSQTIADSFGIYLRPFYAGNAGTITNAYGLFFASGSGTGTISNAWSALINTPLYGTTGTGNIGVQIVGVDTAGSTTGSKYWLYLSGRITGDDGFWTVGILNSINLQPTTTSRTIFGQYNNITATVQSTNTINIAYGLRTDLTVTVGAGTVTTAYTGYFKAPTAGTNATALYTDNLAVGYTATTPPSNGAIISGNVSIGSSSAISNTSLSISTARSSTGGITYQQLGIAGSFTAASTSGLANMLAASISTSFIAASTQTVNVASGIYVNLTANANIGTLSALSGITVASGTSGTGTISKAIGVLINTQNYGTTQVNLGLDIFGGDATASTTGTCAMIKLEGSITGNEGSTIYGINNRPTLNPTTNSINVYASYNSITAQTYSTNNIPNAIGVYGLVGVDISSGGTITNTYSGYFSAPGGGTNKTSLYTADLSVGVLASGTPTAGTVRTAPPASHTAISFGTSLTLGTALQNTLGYDILVNICVSVTAAVSANFQIGVGSTNTPTKDNILPASISAAETFTVCVIVPHNYYVLLDKTGTSSTSTNQLIVTAI